MKMRVISRSVKKNIRKGNIFCIVLDWKEALEQETELQIAEALVYSLRYGFKITEMTKDRTVLTHPERKREFYRRHNLTYSDSDYIDIDEKGDFE